MRWRGGVAATVLLAVAGLHVGNGALLLAAAIPLVYVAAGLVSTVEAPASLAVTRTVDPTPAVPGRPVRVTLTVTNGSDRTLPDVRVVDGVPEDLAVLDGTPRAGTALGPGETCTVEYALVARRGRHAFAAPRLRLRDAGASAVATTTPDVDGDDELVCRLDADAPPVDGAGSGFAGRHVAARPGEGVEFHSTREYRPGDGADRIDWRQYAKRGTLATVNYEREVAATVVFVLDARPANRVVAGPGRPTAVELSAYAATRALSDLLRDGRDVAVAVLGLDGPGPAGLHWLPVGGGPAQRARSLDLFRTAADAAEDGDEPADADEPAVDVDEQVTKLAALAPTGAQLVTVSPLLDDPPVDAVETWRASGFPQVVLSPDVLSTNTVSGQFESIRRRTRLARCGAAGARPIDWRRGTPLALVVEYAFAAEARAAGATGVSR